MPRPRSPPRAGSAPSTTGTTTPSMPTAIARPATAVPRSLMRGSPRVAAGRSTWRGRPHRYGAQRARSRVLDSPRDTGGDAHDLAGARDARLHRAEEEPGLALLDDPDVRRGGDRSGAPLPRSHLDQHDIDVRAVLGSREQPAVALSAKLLTAAHPQIDAFLLELLLDEDRVKPRLLRGRDPMVAQRLQNAAVVGVAAGKVEHKLGRHLQARHARVIDRAAELVVPRRSGQRRPGLIEHPRQMRIALQLDTEGPRLAISEVPGRPNTLRQSPTLHALGRHRLIIAADARRPSRALQPPSRCAHGSGTRVAGNVPLLDEIHR